MGLFVVHMKLETSCSHLLKAALQDALAVARQPETDAAVVEFAREVAVPPNVDDDVQVAVVEHSAYYRVRDGRGLRDGSCPRAENIVHEKSAVLVVSVVSVHLWQALCCI